MEQIRNLSAYNDGMAKSLDDKLFFIPIIGEEIRWFEDFGCADGTLLQAMDRLFNNPFTAEFPLTHKVDLVGYDMSSKMLELAEDKVPNAYLFNSKVPCHTFIDGASKGSVLNLSSVLHEVNSYCTEEEKNDFWKGVHNGNYQYITIRDMIFNGNNKEHSAYDDESAIRGKASLYKYLKEFEEIWGDIHNKKNLVHFLLKYRYKQNWDREVRENYLGYSTDDIIKLVGNEYEAIYRKDYILPFLYNRVEEDFGIKIDTPTHTNLIFKRK